MTVSFNSYFNAVTGVRDCIITDLDEQSPLGKPDRVLVAPGNLVSWDGCECGQLALIFTHGPYPTDRFPLEQITDSQGKCALNTAVQVTASLTRCEYHPSPDVGIKITYPTQEQQTQAAYWQMYDEFIMRNAIVCCLVQMMETYQIDDFRIGASDYNVSGMCGEIAIVFYVQII